jgi:hypothetical protein
MTDAVRRNDLARHPSFFETPVQLPRFEEITQSE